ncbi:MAG: flagellar filament capping protein FliD [Ilumatobacteraceae bacterium]
MSSIDTKSIVNQMMAIERRPQDLLRSRLSSLQSEKSAWSSISDKLTSLKTAADAIAAAGSLSQLIAVSSDDPSSVSVAASGQLAGATSAQIEVTRLAAAHTVVMDDVFGGSTADDGGRTLDITIGGNLQSFTSDDGTIGGLAREINAADVGVTARILQTSAGNYQLTLTSSTTGAAAAFTVDTADWTGATTARQGVDAEFSVDGVSMTRATNSITDAIEGLDFTLHSTTAAPVTISAQRDDDAIVAKVKSLVDSANSVLSTVKSLTANSVTASGRGVLASDSIARSVSDRIRSFIAQGITTGDGSKTSASLVGVSLNQDGTIAFSETKLRENLTSTPEAVIAALGRGGTSTADGISVAAVTKSASEEQHIVTVTKAATQANLVGAVMPPPPPGSTIAMTVVTPSGTQSIQFTAGASFAETAANMTMALRGVGIKATANGFDEGGGDAHFEVTTDGYGSKYSIELSGAGAVALGVDGSAEGEDAEVDLDGESLVATGRTLLKNGVSYLISASQAEIDGAGGSITSTIQITNGLAGGLSNIGEEGGSTGLTSRANTALADRISEIQDRISQWDDRLAMRQRTLEQRFTAMDRMLQQLNSVAGQMGFATA